MNVLGMVCIPLLLRMKYTRALDSYLQIIDVNIKFSLFLI